MKKLSCKCTIAVKGVVVIGVMILLWSYQTKSYELPEVGPSRVNWSPDGKKLIFIAHMKTGDYAEFVHRRRSKIEEQMYTWIINADGSNLKKLDLDLNIHCYTWTANQTQLICDRELIATDSIDPTQHYELIKINPDGSNETVIWDHVYAHGWHFDKSPDGLNIATHTWEEDDTELHQFSLDKKKRVKLTDNNWGDNHPSYSPDGKKIAFHSNRSGNTEIYVMNKDGSNLEQLTWDITGEFCPDWSPDGSNIIFMSDRDGHEIDHTINREKDKNVDIYVMDRDGSNQINLTKNPGNDYFPQYSPYGSKIAFSSNRNGEWEIYVMNSDGSDVVQLTGEKK
jgi:Tol biopolymer transport system component